MSSIEAMFVLNMSKNHPAFNSISHRPWELPAEPWTWRQSWCDLLFAHWPVEASLLRPLVPEGLTIQEFDGTSWIGIVPFRMEGVMRRPLPDIPWISAFPELNVRLYVEYEGKPGVWFLSLDATNPLAVWAARWMFNLPYFRATMKLKKEGEWVRYSSHRTEGEPLLFRGRYKPVSEVYTAEANTLEHWLTERYCLYAEGPKGTLYRAEVHHEPWPLQQAKANIEINQMALPYGIDVSNSPTVLHFASRLDVVVWPLEQVG